MLKVFTVGRSDKSNIHFKILQCDPAQFPALGNGITDKPALLRGVAVLSRTVS